MPETAREAASAKDSAVLTGDLAKLAGQLTDVLTQETALVRAMRVPEIAPLQSQKISLTAEYQSAFKALTKAHEKSPLPTALKAQLAASAERLAKAVMENELALRVGKVATERLIGSIVAALKEQNKATASYARQRAPGRHRFMTAAAIDRRL